MVGCRLFIRATHSVALTVEGEAMVAFARGILETNERAMRFLPGAKVRGRLRFGAAEHTRFMTLAALERAGGAVRKFRCVRSTRR